MNLTELKAILDQIGCSVTYSHFNDTAPSIPYICYRFIDSENHYADDVVYSEGLNVDIELYTRKKDLDTEKKIKELLIANNINFEQSEVYISSEKLFKNTFEVELR